jgi:hypothetical protein
MSRTISVVRRSSKGYSAAYSIGVSASLLGSDEWCAAKDSGATAKVAQSNREHPLSVGMAASRDLFGIKIHQ